MSKKKLIIIIASILVVVVIGAIIGLGIGRKEKDIIELYCWSFMSSLPNQILPKYSDERAVFECSVDKGYFSRPIYTTEPWYEHAKNLTAKPSETIFWFGNDIESEERIDVDVAYADFILRLDDKIIGYAVIKITSSNSGHKYDYNAEILKSKVFKNWLGQYIGVSEEYVTWRIERIKAKN